MGFPTWNDVTALPCHTPMPATKKLVLQYPTGTGMVQALFPPGFQVIPLYVTATLIVFGFALLGIISARSVASVLLGGAFGCLAVYLMINPSKASYSTAPTMVACAAAGYLTARLFTATPRHRLWLTSCSACCRACRSISACLPCSSRRDISCSSCFILVFPENAKRCSRRGVRCRFSDRDSADAACERHQRRQS